MFDQVRSDPVVLPALGKVRKRMGANSRSSLPGLTRQSINLRKSPLTKKMDARVKPAHDSLAPVSRWRAMEDQCFQPPRKAANLTSSHA